MPTIYGLVFAAASHETGQRYDVGNQEDEVYNCAFDTKLHYFGTPKTLTFVITPRVGFGIHPHGIADRLHLDWRASSMSLLISTTSRDLSVPLTRRCSAPESVDGADDHAPNTEAATGIGCSSASCQKHCVELYQIFEGESSESGSRNGEAHLMYRECPMAEKCTIDVGFHSDLARIDKVNT